MLPLNYFNLVERGVIAREKLNGKKVIRFLEIYGEFAFMLKAKKESLMAYGLKVQ